MLKIIFQKLGVVNTSFVIYLVLCIATFFATNRFMSLSLAWNAFLAWVAICFMQVSAKYKKISIPFLILAILFLPNTFYMITSFVHANNLSFYTLLSPNHAVYIENLTPWVEIILIAIGAIFGWVVGLISVKMIVEKIGKWKIAIPFVLSLLSGFGIWIGRFPRLNSWDIFRPIFLFENITSRFGWFAICFSLLFAVTIFASYLIFSRIKLEWVSPTSFGRKSPKSSRKLKA